MVDQKVFAAGRVSIWWVPDGGIADINAPNAAEINAGVKLSKATAWENYELGASESEDVDDRSLMDRGNATTRGAAQFAGTLSFFRDTDPNDTTSPYVQAFEAFRTPRAYGYLVVRVLQNTFGEQDDAAVGQDVSVYRFVADSFVDDTEGDDSVKFTVNFLPQGQLGVYVKVAGGTAEAVPSAGTVAVGASAKIVLNVAGDDVSVGTKWESDDTTIVTVSPFGVITGVAAGTADVTATFAGATAPVTIPVTVS